MPVTLNIGEKPSEKKSPKKETKGTKSEKTRKGSSK